MKYTKLTAAFAAASLIASFSAIAAEGKNATKMPAKESSSGATTSDSAKADMATVVLVPIFVATDDKLANGCWARLYDKPGYDGNMLTMTGPVSVADTSTGLITGLELGRGFDSVAVGPNATLAVWDENNYEDKTAIFKSGQKVTDLDTKMGWFDEIKSYKLSCAK